MGAPFPYGSSRGVHGVPAFKRYAAGRRCRSILMGGPDLSGPYECHHPPPAIQVCLQGRHVCRPSNHDRWGTIPVWFMQRCPRCLCVQAARPQPSALFNPEGRAGYIRPLRVPPPPTGNPGLFAGAARVPPVESRPLGHHSRMVHAAVSTVSLRSSSAPTTVVAVLS